MERCKNAKHNKALELLDRLLEEMGFDEDFTVGQALEYLAIETKNSITGKKTRAWFGQGEMDYLEKLGYIEGVEKGKYRVTLEGMTFAERR